MCVALSFMWTFFRVPLTPRSTRASSRTWSYPCGCLIISCIINRSYTSLHAYHGLEGKADRRCSLRVYADILFSTICTAISNAKNEATEIRGKREIWPGRARCCLTHFIHRSFGRPAAKNALGLFPPHHSPRNGQPSLCHPPSPSLHRHRRLSTRFHPHRDPNPWRAGELVQRIFRLLRVGQPLQITSAITVPNRLSTKVELMDAEMRVCLRTRRWRGSMVSCSSPTRMKV